MKINRTLGSMLIIIGITIGAGTLALPIVLSGYGFLPTLALLILAWLIMTFAGLFVLEINLWLPEDTNLISMAKAILGPGGEIATWFSYLLLFYALLSAYVLGLGDIFSLIVASLTGIQLGDTISSLLSVGLLAIIIYLSTIVIDIANRLFMIGLLISFFLLFVPLAPHVDTQLLTISHSPAVYMALPVALIAFGYHNLIPGLRTYMKSDGRKLRLAMVYGSVGTLIINITWTLFILGVVPYGGESGLLAIQSEEGDAARNLVTAIDRNLGVGTITSLFNYFAYFAISTSMLAVAYALFDFLADGLCIRKSLIGRFILILLVFIPPFIVGFYFANFIGLLRYGAIFVVILFLFLPSLMILRGRKKHPEHTRTIGGNIAPWLMILVAIAIIVIALKS